MSVLGLTLALSVLAAPDPGAPPVPQDPTIKVGQPGKDVIWVPTPAPILARMLAMAQVQPSDLVVDLGAGDGRMVIAAAKQHGARGLGIELDPRLIAAGNKAARAAGLRAGQVEMRRADLFTADIRDATVVLLYLLPEMNRKLRTKLLNLRPGTRIVAHQFGIPEWEPDEISWHERRAAMLWVVPAQVAGGWRVTLPNGQVVDLDLEQRCQTFKGRAHLGDVLAGLRATRLHADAIEFAYVDGAGVRHAFTGTVAGEAMAGEVTVGAARGAWTAVRRR